MIGPTGVGKTEIARRLARLAGAPFLKVEASKFTEVGYVGRDVESMVRELVDVAINMVRGEREDDVYPAAEARAEERLLDILLPPVPAAPASPLPHTPGGEGRGAGEKGERPLFVVSSKGDVTPKRSEEHTSELQSPDHLVCRLLLEKKKMKPSRSPTRLSGSRTS